jgi:hypothetical protein
MLLAAALSAFGLAISGPARKPSLLTKDVFARVEYREYTEYRSDLSTLLVPACVYCSGPAK